MLTLLLLGTSASIFLFSPSLAQPSEGDWNVIGVEVVENETIELSGNLTIKAGGSLTLRNVTLRMNVEHNGQYGISVEEGGALSIYNSNISSATAFRFFYSVVNASFIMKDSELRSAGWGGQWDWGAEPKKRGLHIQADDAVIDANLISDSLGVFLCLCHNSSVTNNRLVTDYGITVAHNVPPFTPTPSNNTILNNTIQGALEFGITIGAGNSNVVANNTILDAMVGIMLAESWDNIVVNNRVNPEHHPDPWGGIVLWSWCGNNTIANNTVKTENPKGIIDGIEVVRSVNNRIEGNIVENLLGGITLSYSHNNVLANNNISNIWRGTDPMHFYSPSSDAIQLYHSSNNTIINNQISRVQSNAIILWDMSKNNVLQANVIDSSYNGIGLHYSSDNNTIANNEVGRIGSWTIVLDESNENIAYHNSFLDPIIEAYDDGMNYWNLEGHGNYWGDYEGQDVDGDGVGDAPYQILPRGTDDFPLMKPEPVTFVPIPILEAASPPLWPPDRPRATITTEETWKNTVVTMDGITVKNGGNLTLQNVTVMFCSVLASLWKLAVPCTFMTAKSRRRIWTMVDFLFSLRKPQSL
jgi:parallel beta-helix repeat protein